MILVILYLIESLFLREESKELSSGTVLKDKKYFLLVLEGRINFNKEGVLDGGKYVSLHHNSFDLILFLNIFLFHRLDSIKLSILFLADKNDLSV